jgi:hypothetical protein
MIRIVAALMAAAVGWLALAQAPMASSTARLAAPWKIAGVGLGMTPAEVGTALAGAGYRLDYRYPGRSWQGEVAEKVSTLRGVRLPPGAQVTQKEDYRKGQEQVHVTYLPGRKGPYVASVDYAIDTDAIDAERFRAAALTKFGRPSLRWDWELQYCVPEEPQCSRAVSLVTNQLPTLTVYVIDATQRRLQLREGERADKAFDAAVRAEAERLFPKKDRPSF